MKSSKIKSKKHITPRNWTLFGFELEERLGDLFPVEETLNIFSDILKNQVPYDYLEIMMLPGSQGDDAEPSNWVRNDTGYGGKLLSIILNDRFIHGLPRRRQPAVISLEKCNATVTNPELLRVMELHRGILIPVLQGNRAQGVIMLFFQKQRTFDAETKRWLMISAQILYRALNRSERFFAAKKMATIDGLTGLYNHSYFMGQLQKEFTRARRYRNWLSLIMIDIDHFKEYNDNNGHLAGDRVLIRVAQTIKKSVREMDLVARWGGEEFALLLPEINLKNGMIVAEKIRKGVESQRFRNEKQQPSGKLTISLGVAENSSSLKTYRDMFKKADSALYQAKHEGRNRCAFVK